MRVNVAAWCYWCGLSGGSHQTECLAAPEKPSRAALEARVVELETALRDLAAVAEKRLRNYIDQPLADATRAARRVLGDTKEGQ